MKWIKLVFIAGMTVAMSFPLMANNAEKDSMEISEQLTLPTIHELRRQAGIIPGEFPQQIRVTKIAETIRPASVVVRGEDPNRKMTLARTVYQLVYASGTIMLDSGMDMETHRTFGKTEEPYFPENFEQVNRALDEAKLIVLTHYHADHTAGLIRSPKFVLLAPKVWVSSETADLLVEHPHKETVRISREKVNSFIISDFDHSYPIAPGFVIFKSPGHTPDSKMMYIQLADGREFIHSVDAGWSMENIVKERMKNASWVNENEGQLLAQYQWLNQVMREYPSIQILCTHDNEQYLQLQENRVLGNGMLLD